MRITVLFALAASLIGSGDVSGQGGGYVYHGVGPVIFTNAAAWGYADGQLAGTNFSCGVYAGTSADSLMPCFGNQNNQLKGNLSTSGQVVFWGTLPLVVPSGDSILVQFRVWPAEYATYEQALAFSQPSPPVGVSAISQAIPDGWIVELPIQVGTVWVSPVPEPSAAGLVVLSGLVLAARRIVGSARREPGPNR